MGVIIAMFLTVPFHSLCTELRDMHPTHVSYTDQASYHQKHTRLSEY